MYGLADSGNADDLAWPLRSLIYIASRFKCDFLYICAAGDEIATDIEHG